MGWLFSNRWTSPSDVRNELLSQLQHDGRRVVEHASTAYGRRMYAVVETRDGERFLFVALIDGNRKEGFGYKDMDESMGPVVCDCPLRLLDMVPDPGGHATAWRERVRAYHANARATFAPGDACTIYGTPYTVLRQAKRSWIVQRADGAVFKASARNMQRIGGAA